MTEDFNPSDVWSYLTPEEQEELLSLQVPTLAEFVSATLPHVLDPWQVHMCERLEKLRYQTGQKILLHSVPQIGKSTIVGSRLPAYLIGCNPGIRVGVSSFNLSNACDFSTVNLSMLRSEQFRAMFPSSLCELEPNTPKEKWSVQGRVLQGDTQSSFTALGMEGGYVGRGFDLLVVDDPYPSGGAAFSVIENEKLRKWWDRDVKDRLSDGQGNVVIIFHRWHSEDFAAHLLAEGDWEYIRYPAFEDGDEEFPSAMGLPIGTPLSPRWTPAKIEELRKRQLSDPVHFSGHFQGVPRAAQGGAFELDWFVNKGEDKVVIKSLPTMKNAYTGEDIPAIDYWVRAYDTATTTGVQSNHTAGALVGMTHDGIIVLADLVRWKQETPEIARLIAEQVELDRQFLGKYPTTGIEHKGTGVPLFQILSTNPVFLEAPLEKVEVVGDKKQRIAGWQTKVANRKFMMLEGDWNVGFKNSCLAWHGRPGGDDDSQDAVSLAMSMLSKRNGGPQTNVKPIIQNSLDYYKALAEANGYDIDTFDECA